MRQIEIKLYSEYRHYGSHGPKPHKVKATVASKARSVLQLNRNKSASNGSSNGPEEPKDQGKRQAKAYGTHAGNVHVQTLYSGELTESNSQSILTYLDNVTSRFEGITSWDLQQAKHSYSTFKDAKIKEYEAQYGTELSERTATSLLQELSQRAFDYTQHQIVVTIISDEQFDGSSKDADSEGMYRRELRSKRIYTQGRNLLSQDLRTKLAQSSKKDSELTSTSILSKGGRITINPRTKQRMFTIDFGQLAGRIHDVDDY